MKTCVKCKQEKSFNEFYKNSRRKDGYQDYCKSCKKKTDAEQFQKHKEKWVNHYNNIKKKRRVKINEIKSKGCCKKCGESRPYVLDYHHINPNTKSGAVADMVSYSWKKVTDEIKKCVLLCRNCHSEFHYLERKDNLTIEKYLKLKILK